MISTIKESKGHPQSVLKWRCGGCKKSNLQYHFFSIRCLYVLSMCCIELLHHFREHGKVGVVVEAIQQVVQAVHQFLQQKNNLILINKHLIAPSLPKISKIE